jgi:predicted CXXCH cytochrome family protein
MVIATVALIAVGLTAWATPTASANGGPHGNFTLTTSGCGGCHRAHTAISPYLIKAENQYQLCTSCHGGLVSTDVVHGQFGSTGAPLNGGGFEQAVRMSDFISGTPAAGAVGPVTSSHTVADLPVGGVPASGSGSPWGSTTSGVATGPGTLECTSCHNPHGSTNYRILRDAATTAKWIPNDANLLNWVNYQVLATTDDNPPVYGFTLDTSNCPASVPAVIGGTPRPVNTAVSSLVGGTPAAQAGIYIKCKARYTSGVFAYTTTTPVARGATAVPNVLKGMNAFCATCHKSYLTITGSAQNFNSQNTPTAQFLGLPTNVPGTFTAAQLTAVALGTIVPTNTPTSNSYQTYLTAIAQWPPAVGVGTPTPGYPFVYPGTQDLGDGAGSLARYRHAVDRTHNGGKQPLRFAALGNDPTGGGSSLAYAAFGCLTCHFAHGSAAAATPAALTGGFAIATPTPGGIAIPADGPAGDSSLLFYSNRGVCITCHQSVGPVPTPTAY